MKYKKFSDKSRISKRDELISMLKASGKKIFLFKNL